MCITFRVTLSTVNDVTQKTSLSAQLKAVFTPNGNIQTAVPVTHIAESSHHFCHPHALVDGGTSIGKGTRVWAFAHVVAGAVIGEDCNICDHTFIEGKVQLGNRVTLKCGVFLWNGMTIEDDVFIGPGAVFTNDYRPRSKRYLETDLKTHLKEGCSIGANSTTLPNLTIGRWAMVGAGSVVTHSVPDFALVMGNPAQWRAWICRCGEKLTLAFSGVLKCDCGNFYEQISNNEVRAIVTNGHARSLLHNNGVTDSGAAINKGNGLAAANGHTKMG